MAYSGKFSPTKPSKYKGDIHKITWRSLWELKVMRFLDEQDAILEWSSEEISIPYISPIDNRIHRYYPDFYVKKKQSDGKVVRQLIEVKPKKQTAPPKLQKRLTPKYLTEIKTWGINEAKWKAAERFCEDVGWEFVWLTEDDLGIK